MQGVEPRHQFGVEEVVGAGEGAEGHGAAGEVPHGIHRGDRLLGRRDRAFRVRQQHPRGVGEDQLPIGADEEADPELLLQPSDLLRQARLGDEMRLGGVIGLELFHDGLGLLRLIGLDVSGGKRISRLKVRRLGIRDCLQLRNPSIEPLQL